MSTYGGEQQQPVYIERTNGLAIAGLVISILGIMSGGVLSPIGLILSLVALGKPVGKGIAWAGVIIGFIGTCGWEAWMDRRGRGDPRDGLRHPRHRPAQPP